jgi:tRNA (guanine26-N2/guanine27-N2)-dimethyltransferase
MKVIKEGATRIIVPTGVFYNPKMELSRDINIACVSAFSNQNERYVDALAATGIMGIRVAKEVGLDVTINDLSRRAYNTILKNVKLKNVECDIHNEDANVLLSKRGYDIVDIDPFGSPAPFLDASCASVRRLLITTATDTAPLCGAHKNAGIRKYSAVPLRTEYYKEMGVRILLGKIIRDLARHDKSAHPLLSYTVRHFIRSYILVEKGAKRADKSIEKLGYITHCFRCGDRSIKAGLIPFIDERCRNCGYPLRVAGPVYLGGIHDHSFCLNVLNELERRDLGEKKHAMRIIRSCSEELDLPFYYDHHHICKRLGVSVSSMEDLIRALREERFDASRTHFSGTSFKTNAKVDEVEEIVRSMI